MTKINSFYHGLRQLSQDAESKITLQSKVTQEGNAYLLVLLPHAYGQCIMIQGVAYEIVHHHLSVYADYQPFSRHSDTHYTAHLKTASGEEGYVLHVYFDAKDQCIDRPSFVKISHTKRSGRHATKKTKEVVDVLVCDEEDDQLLSAMAVALSTSVLSDLRQGYQTHVHAAQTKIMTFLETFRLLDAIPEIEHCLTELDFLLDLSLSLQDPTYQKCLAVYKETLSWKQAELLSATLDTRHVDSVVVAAVASASHEMSSSKKSKPQASKASKKTAAVSEKKNHEMLACVTKMEAAKARYLDTLQRETLTMKTYPALGALEAYYGVLQEIDLLSMEISFPQQFRHGVLQQLLLMQNQCVMYFEKALRSKDDLIIGRLKGYAKFVSDQILIEVLKSGDATSLGLLLQHGTFPINRIVWVDEEGKPANLLEYAFHHQLTECFDCLLQHHASLLTTVMSPWPLADRLLQAEGDPCSMRFKSCYVGKKREVLLKALCAALRSLDAEPTAELMTRLQDYERMTRSLGQLPARSFQVRSTDAAAVEEDLQKIRAESQYLDVPSLIRSSQRLQGLEMDVNRVYTDYFKLLSRSEQSKELRDKRLQTHMLANITPCMKKENLSREALHDQIEAHFIQVLDYYSLKIERIDLEKVYKEQRIRLKTNDPVLLRLAEVRALLSQAESQIEAMHAFDSMRDTMLKTLSHVVPFISKENLSEDALRLFSQPNSLFHDPDKTMRIGLELLEQGMTRFKTAVKASSSCLLEQADDADVEKDDGLHLKR